MEMHQLRYFAKVAELGNVTRAAEACFVSQPSLSQQIAKLERELGQPLLERLGRGVRLTPAGQLFKEYAGQILRLADDARSRVADDPDAGRLVVGAIPTVAPYFLPGILARYGAECPRARVEVVEETTAPLLRLLAAGEVDLAVLALPVPAERLVVEPLLTEELVAVLPSGHRLAGRPRLTVKELAAEPFVLLNEAHCLSGSTLSLCGRHAAAPAVTARGHQLTLVLELVRLGLGVSLVPEMAVPAGRDAGRVYRPVRGDRATRTVAAAWVRTRHQTQIFKRFVAALKAAGAAPRGVTSPS